MFQVRLALYQVRISLSADLAGVFASLVSQIATARLRFPRAVKELTSRSGSKEVFEAERKGLTRFSMLQKSSITPSAILPSLGASGAVYSTLVITALAFPDTLVGITLLPLPSFPIQYGVGGLVAMDIIGALRGWRLFDHYAHLGGAAFGLFYWSYGAHWWDNLRASTSKRDSSTSTNQY